MNRLSKFVLIPAFLALAFCASARAEDSAAVEKEILARAQLLLDRYQANDQDGVLELMDAKFLLLGSDFSEIIRNPPELRGLMTRDFEMWKTARFGAMRDVDVRTSDTLATAYFVVDFTASTGQPIPVRLFTTWRKVGKEWRLTQSASAVPPQG